MNKLIFLVTFISTIACASLWQQFLSPLNLITGWLADEHELISLHKSLVEIESISGNGEYYYFYTKIYD